MLKKCERCGDDFAPYVGRQRFCTRECSDAWFADERREAVKRHREAHRTYHAMAVGDPDAEGGPVVVGSAPLYGADLPGPAWSRDLAALPKERPLGERVDALNDISAVWFDPDYIAPKASE